MDTLVVVGVETLDEVDTDEDVETELEVDTLQRKFKRNYYRKLFQICTTLCMFGKEPNKSNLFFFKDSMYLLIFL